jgi:hypothetical protein
MRVTYLYIKKKRRKRTPKSTQLQEATHPEKMIKQPTHHYSPGVPMAYRREMPLAPAMDHIRASSFATRRAATTLGAAPLKTHAFLCFQITHTPNITRVLKSLLELLDHG